MRNDDVKPWFAAKRRGYGAGLPITWQGWAATAILLAGIVGTLWLGEPARFIAVTSLIIAFSILCAFKTRGGWRWRWDE